MLSERLIEKRERIRFSPEEFYTLHDLGMLDKHTELVDGEIIQMPAQYYAAGVTMRRVTDALRDAWHDRDLVPTEVTVAFSSGWNPLPDVAVYDEAPPWHPRDSAYPIPRLIVEIADSTLDYDLQDKPPRYAAEGVQELWVADVEGRTMHVFRDPVDGRYETTFALAADQNVTSLCMPDLELVVGDLIPSYPSDAKK